MLRPVSRRVRPDVGVSQVAGAAHRRRVHERVSRPLGARQAPALAAVASRRPLSGLRRDCQTARSWWSRPSRHIATFGSW